MKQNKGGRPVIGPTIKFKVYPHLALEAQKLAAERNMTLAEWMRRVLERAIAAAQEEKP